MKKKLYTLFIYSLGVCFIGLILHITNIGCPIKFVTGCSCPGCGMTRAWLNVLHFNFSTAFYYHPLFWVLPLLIPIMLFQDRINPKIYKFILFLVLLLFIVVYFYRLFDPNNTIVEINFSKGCIYHLIFFIGGLFYD
ncbi:Protein of unknown function [Lachnospiraceae bacterium C7]|nr:Protein of unknown function [Lachnospiraceae bacterium C7]